MKFTAIKTAAVTGLLFTFSCAGADQTDPRLDTLFALLAETTDTALLNEVENRIWAIWYEHPDREVASMLAAGERMMNAGYYGDALQVFSTLIERQPDYAEAWNRRATLYYLMERYPESLADIEKTLALEPRHFGALSGLGLVYLQQDNLPRAREAFENLLAIHPHSPAARENLERVLNALRMQFI